MFLVAFNLDVAADSAMIPPSYELVNGRWFDGSSFATATVYTSGGYFTGSRPAKIDSVIDLAGGWVIPPLAEGHIHDLNNVESIDERLLDYQAKGIQYVMVQDALFPLSPELRAKTKGPETPDVVYASGVVLTEHSEIASSMYRTLASRGAFGEEYSTLESLDGHVLFFVNDAADVREKWSRMAELNTDIVKIIVSFTDDFERRLSLPDTVAVPRPALRPEMVGELVRTAHANGRRVSAHIETAADFRLAVEAGADIIAHLPGWRVGAAAGYPDGDLEPWMLSDEDARRAADAGVVVVTTTLPKSFLPNWESNLPYYEQLHKHNLSVLNKHGVRIAIGSDSGALVLEEILHIDEFGVLDNLTLLNLATRETASMIFPKRRIGKLEAGFEASFLVLAENPLEDLNRLESIRLQVKQGSIVRANP